MQPEQWESPRAKAERERRERVLAFEALMTQVDAGELTLDQAKAIQQLGTSGIESRPATVYQQSEIERLERSIDGAEAGDA